MRKYVKPELYYENFELTQNIAACTLKITANVDSVLSDGCYADGYVSGDSVFADMPLNNAFLKADTDCTQKLDGEIFCVYAGANPLATHMS